MKSIGLFILMFSFLSCVTTNDRFENKQKTLLYKKYGLEKKSTETQAITTETLSADPAVPIQNTAAPVATNFFILPKTEVLQKERSSESFSVDAKKVGAILPLTGKNANVGQHALAALRLGLGLTESSPALSLVLFDSQGNPALAAAGVQKLLKDDHVIAIFGGLGAKEALAISERADFYQVPFFTFSQKSGLVENSE